MARIENTLVVDLLRESMVEGRRPFLTITSNSMAPLLRRGDQIAVEPVAVEDLRPGDVIVLNGVASLMTHRFWGTVEVDGNTRLVTRGDRPLSFDAPWDPARLVGRVAGRRRDGRLLPLDSGPGRVLNRHLTHLAALEARLFAGFHHHPLAQGRSTTVLGRALRANRRHLPARLIRRAFLTWATLVTAIIQRFARLLRGDMKIKETRVALTVLLFGLLAAVLWHPGRDAHASVNLSTFFAESGSDSIILHWETGNELNNLGFNIWRGTSCDPATATKVNDSLIASQVGGQATGADYEYADAAVTAGVVYDYRLESIDSNTGGECHQDFPVQASLESGGTINTPTANDGSPTPIPTSTTAPTATPQPTATPDPGQTDPTQAPTRTPSPTQASVTATRPGATVTATATGVSATTAPATGDDTTSPTATQPPDAEGANAEATTPRPTATATGDADVIAAAETGQSDGVSNTGAEANAPAGDTDDVPPAIGAGSADTANAAGSDTTAATDETDTSGPSLPTWAIMALAAGLVFVVGGSATIIYLLKNQ